MTEKGSTTGLVPVSSGNRRDRSFFSLEMTPAGVRICLDHAVSKVSGGTVAISELILSVPWVKYPFDYTSGPRALQSHLTVLDSVTVDIGFDLIRKFCSACSNIESPEVETDPAHPDRLIISGECAGYPFSVRAGFIQGFVGELKVDFEYPRIFGLSDLSWSRVPLELYSACPDCVKAGRFEFNVLRPVLKTFMTGLGFKLPLIDRPVLESVTVLDERVRFSFVKRSADETIPSEVTSLDYPEVLPAESSRSDAPSDVLGRLNSGTRNLNTVVGFIESGIGHSVLWPEILARSLALGNEHPECVSAQLAAALTGTENPGWIGSSELFLVCRRLLAAVEAEGFAAEYIRAAIFVSSVLDRFEPAEAMALLDEMRAAGIENQPVLEAVSVTLDRLGRYSDASTTRLRSLAMVPVSDVSSAMRNMVQRMDANGFSPQASAWLVEIAELCQRGRFGSAGPSIYRAAALLMVARGVPSGKETSWQMLRQLLTTDPVDCEVLELMLTSANERHEVVEVIDLFRSAADSVDGPRRCHLLLTAGRAVYEKFGLRHRAAELLAAALDADPDCKDAAQLLDFIYDALGRSVERMALAERRLERCDNVAQRTSLLVTLMETAEVSGSLDKAASAVKRLLKHDPANIEYLKAAVRILGEAGDAPALREAREALSDLGVGKAVAPVDESSVDVALAAGDIPGAVAALTALVEGSTDHRIAVERLAQASDLALMGGLPREAAALLARLAGLDPVVAVQAAARALAVPGQDYADVLLPVVRLAASCSLNVGRQSEAAFSLSQAAEKMLDICPVTATSLLETCVMLEPDNVSAVMTLAAVYESMGMVRESESLLSGVD